MSKSSKRTADIGFAAISVEGGLITPEQLVVIASATPDQRAATDYGCPKGTSLRDEITRYFRIGQAHWRGYAAIDAPTITQTAAFVKALLEEAFGFALVGPVTHERDDRRYRIAWEAKGGRVPIVVAAPITERGKAAEGFTRALAEFGDGAGGGAAKRSPVVLLQDWLNANVDANWGLAFAGDRVRLLRDNASFTRPAHIEADLGAIFRDEMFADFTAIWLLIHATRFGAEGATAGDSALERSREAGLRAGTAVRDRLRGNVENALLALGQGFLDGNPGLRDRIDNGDLTMQEWFEQLLRLVYRLIFLAVAEDRDLLHPPSTSRSAKSLYEQHYGFGSLRDRSARRSAHDRHHDCWEGARIVLRALEHGEKLLGLPALGGLFARGLTPDLDQAELSNRAFLAAVFRLGWLIDDGRRVRINWRDMATEELGSVYEGLLELVPARDENGRRFCFVNGDESRGNARKTSGSYYTPDALVQTLLDSTLDPVVAKAEATGGAEAILRLTVIDPACGSGHFLLGAARRMASRVALLRDNEAPDYPAAMRDVASHCIHGVDRNPMAVELAKVALWIETVEPGKPLTFLDSNIRCGDSLIGVFDIEMLRRGIPDEAYKPLTGDDKDLARAYGRYNKQQRDGKGATGLLSELRPPETLSRADRVLNKLPQDDLRQVEEKSARFQAIRISDEWRRLKSASDLYVSAYLYTAAFFAPKVTGGSTFDDLPLTEHVWRAAAGREVAPHLAEGAAKTSMAVTAFHWQIEFPRIFDAGGFDVVIGNPPWERIKLQELEFFAARSPIIATAPTKSEREKLVKALEKAEPDTPDGRLWTEFQFAKRTAEATSEFVRSSGRYPLTGKGDVNTYALFAEHFSMLSKREGRAGIIIPTGIATDSSTSAFFGNLIDSKRLHTLFGFYEIRAWFKGTDDRKSFCVLCMGSQSGEAEFCFDIKEISELDQAERRFTLTPDQIAKINPNTKTAPVFRSRADAAIAAKLYQRAPVLIERRSEENGGDVNPWHLTFQTMFHMSSDSGHFRTASQLGREGWSREDTDWVRKEDQALKRYVPLYEAKMVHHFDHRFGTFGNLTERPADGSLPETPMSDRLNPAFEPDPWFWVPEDEVALRIARIPSSLKRAWREGNGERCLRILAEWLAGYFANVGGLPAKEGDLARILGRHHPWRAILGASPDRFLLDPKTLFNGATMQLETPLTQNDIVFLEDGSDEGLVLTAALIEHKKPRWLMGWRDITNNSAERTIIGTVFPAAGVGNNLPLWHLPLDTEGGMSAAFLAHFSSLVVDCVGRYKVGGNHLNFFIAEQLPVLPPSAFSSSDLTFIKSRVLELTYNSHAMRRWAEDLGHVGAPFEWNEPRRALLRAELDAFFALKYGLSRDELRYVLDPSDVRGPDYPSETFRVLKSNEEACFSEFRTQRLVLEAFDQLSGMQVAAVPFEVRRTEALDVALHDGAWVRPTPTLGGDVGAALAAILKSMKGPKPIHDVRLAAALILEPRLKEGQNVRLAVNNTLNEETSIHWHGLLVPFQMDGVPGVSFPGIKAGQTFVYEFPVKQSGTYWYHSHSGMQEAMGMYGAIVIDPAAPDPVAYDREHVIMLADWSFMHPHTQLRKLKAQPGYFNMQKQTLSGLLAGKDQSASERRMWAGMRMDPTDISDITGATYHFMVNGHDSTANWTGLFAPGERVRLRIINAAAMTNFDLRIPGLVMTVVAADGQNVQPVETDEFQIGIAETYDVIVEPRADEAYGFIAEAIDRSGQVRATLAPRLGMVAPIPAIRERPLLTMKDMGMGDMAASGGDKSGADHAAMGHDMPRADHGSMKMRDPSVAPQVKLGPGVATLSPMPMDRTGERPTGLEKVGHRVLTYRDLKSLAPNPDKRTPSREIDLHLTANMERYMWSFDGEKFSENTEPIPFRHMERVRINLINDTMMPHPIHLHGHFFELVTGSPGHHPLKHTVNVLPGGKVSFDLTADELGDWAFHCHMLLHMMSGMFRVVTVRHEEDAA